MSVSVYLYTYMHAHALNIFLQTQILSAIHTLYLTLSTYTLTYIHTNWRSPYTYIRHHFIQAPLSIPGLEIWIERIIKSYCKMVLDSFGTPSLSGPLL
jgi:hypothetical protein